MANDKTKNNVKAFVIKPELENFQNENQGRSVAPIAFAQAYLSSPEFTKDALQDIGRAMKVAFSTSVDKEFLAKEIAQQCTDLVNCQHIIRRLILLPKKWGGAWLAKPTDHKQCKDSSTLVTSSGSQEWYGPIKLNYTDDDVWYIRSALIPHIEMPNPTQPVVCKIRWLCFARVTEQYVSLHWQNFNYRDSEENSTYTSQFPYWKYIPTYLSEIEDIIGVKLKPINLNRIVLDTLWDKYRPDKDNYEWEDRRIRAESGGVSLNARAAGRGQMELNVKGIKRLAQTIRLSVVKEVSRIHNFAIPDSEELDETILRTLIKDFGALSYELALDDKEGKCIFRAHCYFGSKPGFNSQDVFPHINFHSSYRSDEEQLHFLLSHLNE